MPVGTALDTLHLMRRILLPSRFAVALAVAALSSSCADKSTTTSDSGVVVPFCRDMADADTTTIDVGGGDPGSGQVIGQLITDDGGDVDDPLIVGQMDYTMENLDVGGPPRAGRTGQNGDFTEEVGAGNWRLSISGTKAGLSCQNQLEIVVEDGNTTSVCIDTLCE